MGEGGPATRRSGPRPPARVRRYLAQFVVNESGAADSASFRRLLPTDRNAGQGQSWSAVRDSAAFHAAWAAIAASTFRPAELGGCTVRMLMQEPATDTTRVAAPRS